MAAAALIGKKIGMTRIYTADGEAVPVTVIQAGPCTVLQVKKSDGKDGYNAVQLGFEDVKPHRSTLPMIGHAAAAGTGPKRIIREVPVPTVPEDNAGDVWTVEVFEAAGTKHVDVVSTTKGRGYTGVMKRYGFGGQPASHGTERKHRSPGAIGGMSQRGRGQAVKKGKRMAGHSGNVRRTSRNQELVRVDKENHLLLVKGSVPGPNGVYVLVRQAKAKK
ncbi:MAG TPA: 50S ribosomal protein L3 [Phycisphaerae bacterium]|nr:50S ribosomal protein L3 [Phycisphaerae bacterium]HON67161.1 50S ribosomal protein L3 [Phycisphaerae bacterium]HPP26189.1 50S ribosomal protein L3 [Phycisphaerae bacterium]